MSLKVFEAFAGIGAQHSALKRTNIDFEVVGISDWFINAILAYDKIHTSNVVVDENISIDKKREFLNNFSFSKDSVKKYDISKLSDEKISELYGAMKRTKNYGSICDVKADDLPDIDMLIYSFPCQDLSTGGKTEGMAKGSGTRSGLLWEIERILNEFKNSKNKPGRMPKFLLLENVRTIYSDSNSKDLDQWLKALELMGYRSVKLRLNSKYFGVPQSRERAYIFSCLKPEKRIRFDVLKRKLQQYQNTNYDCRNFIFGEDYDEIIEVELDAAKLNKTPSREEMWDINGRTLKEDTILNTITCNMDRSNNSGMFLYKDSYRLLSIREAFRLMGFTDEEYESVLPLNLSYRQLNKLIGNSIVVNVLKAIFEEVFKKFDEYQKQNE